jgi:hypothetical protein
MRPFVPNSAGLQSGSLVRFWKCSCTSPAHEVAERLGTGLTVVPRSSVSPLPTDLSFATPGASRYKGHLLLTTWHGVDKKAAPTLWIRIDVTSVGFASGLPFTLDIRDRWRRAIAGPRGTLLARSIDALLKAILEGRPAHG